MACSFRFRKRTCRYQEAVNSGSKPTRSCKQSSSGRCKQGSTSKCETKCICLHALPCEWQVSTATRSLLQQQPRQLLTGAAAQTAGLSESARKQIGFWLAGCSGWVFSMVVLGGMTRLTRSGLSMTDWKFTGETSPQTLVHIIMHLQCCAVSNRFRYTRLDLVGRCMAL